MPSHHFNLPRPGRCKFCQVRVPTSTLLFGTSVSSSLHATHYEEVEEEDKGNASIAIHFPCPTCASNMIVLTSTPFNEVIFQGALVEDAEEAGEEGAKDRSSLPRLQEYVPNVVGDDNRLRAALKRSRQTRQALASAIPTAAPPSNAARMQVVYKKQ